MSLFAQKIQVTLAMSGPYLFRQWHTRFAVIVAPDRRTATLTIHDIYADEFRDLIFEVDVPVISEPAEADPVLTVSCQYDTVTPSGAQRVAVPDLSLTLHRPEATPAGMAADFSLDRQWNRILTAKAMTDATALCQDRKFPEAQALIRETIAKIEASISGTDPVCAAQIQDLRTCASRLVDHTSYESSGKAYMVQQAQQQWHQRTSHNTQSSSAQAYMNPMASAWHAKSSSPASQPQKKPKGDGSN